MRWLSPSRDGEGGERFVEPGEVIDIELGAHGAAAMPRSMLALPPHGGLQPQQHQQIFFGNLYVWLGTGRKRFIPISHGHETKHETPLALEEEENPREASTPRHPPDGAAKDVGLLCRTRGLACGLGRCRRRARSSADGGVQGVPFGVANVRECGSLHAVLSPPQTCSTQGTPCHRRGKGGHPRATALKLVLFSQRAHLSSGPYPVTTSGS